MSLVLDFIKNDLGIGHVCKEQVIKELEQEELFEIKTSFVFPKREIGIATIKDSNLTFATNKFIQLLK